MVPATRPGPVETRLISYGEVKPLVVGHYAEMSAFVEELAGVAAAAGAVKYWRMMRCRDPDAAYGVVLQMLRRSWGMAAFRENARLVVRRLAWVQDARAPALVVNLARDRDRMGRRYENAMEHHPRSGGGAGRPSRSGGRRWLACGVCRFICGYGIQGIIYKNTISEELRIGG